MEKIKLHGNIYDENNDKTFKLILEENVEFVSLTDSKTDAKNSIKLVNLQTTCNLKVQAILYGTLIEYSYNGFD